MKKLIRGADKLVFKYLPSERITSGLRTISLKLRIRSLINMSLSAYYGSSASFNIAENEILFETPNLEEFIILRGLKHDKSTLEKTLSELNRDDVFYDIGANIGLYSCTIAKISGCNVYSFEPHPKNVKRLRKNAKKNDVSINILQKAVSDKNDSETLNIEKNVPGEGQANLTNNKEGKEVEACRLDKIIPEELPSPDLMKIDVEGAEIKVVKGMEELSKEKLPDTIYCEIHITTERYQESPKTVEEKLEEIGYKLETIEKMPGMRKMVKASL